jgi:hypothetical protein
MNLTQNIESVSYGGIVKSCRSCSANVPIHGKGGKRFLKLFSLSKNEFEENINFG